MPKFSEGDKVYMIESNHRVREVTVLRYSGGRYLVQLGAGSGIRVGEHRLFATESEAKGNIPGKKSNEEPRRYRSPYNYDH